MKDYWIQRFKTEALPLLISKFSPQQVLLYGSRITGKAKPYSDIDIVVVSDRFQNIRFIKRMPLLLKAIPFEKHVDYICYTPEEFSNIKNNSSIIIDALETGEQVA
jgi:uncharacterized protein